MFFFAGYFWISPCVWPNSGLWCCVCLTCPNITLLYLEVSNHNLMRQVHSPFHTGLTLQEQGLPFIVKERLVLITLQSQGLNRDLPFAKIHKSISCTNFQEKELTCIVTHHTLFIAKHIISNPFLEWELFFLFPYAISIEGFIGLSSFGFEGKAFFFGPWVRTTRQEGFNVEASKHNWRGKCKRTQNYSRLPF